ncbi:copper resistance CopC/CopD family protein, partial [Actinomadura parmotrematis]
AAAVAVAVLALLLALARPAGAHALLVSSDPAYGAALASAPARVTLRFSEAVHLSRDSVTVRDAAGTLVSQGAAAHAGRDDTAAVALRGGLPHGTYIVTWRLVSADTHPVGGSLEFGIGGPPDPGAAPAPPEPSALLTYAAGLAHAAALLGFALFAGLVLFGWLVWPDALVRRAPRQLLTIGGWLLAVATVAQLLLQGPRTGESLAGTLGYRYGQAAVARLVLLAVAGWALRARTPSRARRVLAGGAVTGALFSEALLGHAAAGGDAPFAVFAVTLHLAAMCLWTGGLTVLVLLVLARPRPDAPLLLRRWSRAAAWAVGVLAVTGAYQAWREVGAFPALGGTPYGRLLLVKLGLFAAALAAAGVARRRLGARTALRRAAAVELTAHLAVLAVTATLTGSRPARTDYGPPFRTTAAAGETRVRVEVAATRTGPQQITVSAPGLAAVTGGLALPGEHLGPFDVRFRPDGPGRFTSQGAAAPRPGTWRLRLSLTTGDPLVHVLTVPYRVH